LILLRSGNQGKKASGLSVATNSPNPMSAVGGIGSGTILPSSGNDNASMGDLLEVSRRLALSKSEREAEQLIVHEAMSLVGASAGALIRNRPNGLSVAYETEENLLLPSGLRSGIIQRAAETGQSIVQVSATEPSIRSLPAALAVAPLVGNGRVGAVVVLARPPDSPFSPSELELLVSLAPVAAAALSSARHTDSLAEDSLVDPLTSLGNRRRLDKEFPELLSSSLGMDIAVMMIDIDYFKQVNDTYGHQVGDEVLRSVRNSLLFCRTPRTQKHRSLLKG